MKERLRRDGRRGSALLESSLCLVTFILVLLAVFDFSHFLFLQQGVTERMRAGLRYGTVHTFDAAAIQNVVLYNNPVQPAGVTPWLNLRREMIAVNRAGNNTPADRVTITISNYQFPLVSPYLARTITMGPMAASLPYEYNR